MIMPVSSPIALARAFATIYTAAEGAVDILERCAAEGCGVYVTF
jgi:hypothetical protein